mmetsp:Transcript_27207/g.78129  ORF Transcript_27207/g.78129 Transcript_27207/m.78129 type:complete len:289 (-) Transcript_27207:538-1404(-)
MPAWVLDSMRFQLPLGAGAVTAAGGVEGAWPATPAGTSSRGRLAAGSSGAGAACAAWGLAVASILAISSSTSSPSPSSSSIPRFSCTSGTGRDVVSRAAAAGEPHLRSGDSSASGRLASTSAAPLEVAGATAASASAASAIDSAAADATATDAVAPSCQLGVEHLLEESCASSIELDVMDTPAAKAFEECAEAGLEHAEVGLEPTASATPALPMRAVVAVEQALWASKATEWRTVGAMLSSSGRPSRAVGPTPESNMETFQNPCSNTRPAESTTNSTIKFSMARWWNR